MVCGLYIPNRLLAEWHGANSYVQELNDCVVSHAIQISSDRIEGRLRRQAGTVINNLRGKSTIKKEQYMEKSYLLQVQFTLHIIH